MKKFKIFKAFQLEQVPCIILHIHFGALIFFNIICSFSFVGNKNLGDTIFQVISVIQNWEKMVCFFNLMQIIDLINLNLKLTYSLILAIYGPVETFKTKFLATNFSIYFQGPLRNPSSSMSVIHMRQWKLTNATHPSIAETLTHMRDQMYVPY